MSGKQTARWRGTRETTEQPESPEWDWSNDEDTCQKVFEGPYDKLLASPPTHGQVLAGMPEGYYVDRVKLKRHKSGKGTLTVSLSRKKSGFAAAGPELPQFEVDWTQVQRAIEEHPMWLPPNDTALTDGDRVDLKEWDDEKNPVLKKAWKYLGADNAEHELSANAQVLAGKKLKGTTSYTIWIPVLKKTTPRRTKKASAGAGFIDTPSAEEFGALPTQKDGTAYKWFKTADRCVKSGRHGKWNEVEEWTGFNHVDLDLYT
jgi:hypothetical protein